MIENSSPSGVRIPSSGDISNSDASFSRFSNNLALKAILSPKRRKRTTDLEPILQPGMQISSSAGGSETRSSSGKRLMTSMSV